VNDKITAPAVRMIDSDGGQLGVMDVRQALQLAAEKGLDLVEVSPTSAPPVCRLMDYGRYKFQQEKKEAESRKHQATVSIKEIKFRPGTGQHDLEFKLRHVKRFLEEGDRVKVTVMFRGREIVHQERGHDILGRVAQNLAELAVVEGIARLEGRHLSVIMVPKKHAGATP
jgi:translation initiation factor IF-3